MKRGEYGERAIRHYSARTAILCDWCGRHLLGKASRERGRGPTCERHRLEAEKNKQAAK
jgi:hypothetical protein